MKINDKKEILEMLSRKEISKEEAERKLSELEMTGTKVMRKVEKTTPNNKGLLLVAIATLVLLPVFCLLAFALLFVA